MFTVLVDAFMAVVRFFRFDKLVGILGFFSSAGPFIQAFIWIGKKLAVKSVIVPAQFAFLGSLVVAKLSLLFLLINFILWIYNTFHSMITSIENFVSQGDTLFSIAWQVLESVGFVDALFGALHTLSFPFFSLLGFIISRFVMHSLKMVSDEFFKIGLLIEA